MEGYYTSGEFAKRANISIRTIRYYDKEGLLKPARMTEAGYRLYTASDFARLQKILSLKYLGFSLEEIRSITAGDEDGGYVEQSLRLQMDLVRKRMEHLKQVEQSLLETSRFIRENAEIDWNKILHLIHITNMEKSLVEQYKNAANITIRIDLHRRYATNPMGWYPWLFTLFDVKDGERALELGCGNGELYRENRDRIPKGADFCLSDISEGMVLDAKAHLRRVPGSFAYQVFDCRRIPKADESYEKVAANHVLFYLKDLDGALQEVFRVLKPGGTFLCSTYGQAHMKEIGQLVKEFDSRITLSEVNLYDVFGLENGQEALERHFERVEKVTYSDGLKVGSPGPLMDYILSCHGNQQEYLDGRYEEFREFLRKKIEKKGTLSITKMAGAFLCRKSEGRRK